MGEGMREMICVLNVHIDNCTAKQAMKATVGYLEEEALNVVELATTESLMYASDFPEFREAMEQSSLILPGQKEILEAAEIIDNRRIQEVEGHIYLKMVLKYLHRNRSRVYLLVESEEEAGEITSCFASKYRGIQIVGAARVAAGSEGDDMVMNAINGGEIDCVIATLPAPIQQEFIFRNRSLMNARLWLGVGKVMEPLYREKKSRSRMVQFLERLFFKREILKNRLKMQIQEEI